MYISEVTEQRLKGSFLNATAIFSGLGIAFGYLFGSHLLWRFACLIPITTNIAGEGMKIGFLGRLKTDCDRKLVLIEV